MTWVRRVFGWSIIGPGVVALAIVAAADLRLTLPDVRLAIACLTVIAILLIVKLAAWTILSPRTFGREERLFVFVATGAVWLGWYGARQTIFERQFDRLVAAQQTQLRLSVVELSGNILNFLEARRRLAPPPPKPETWERDETAVLRFDAETGTRFDRQFGAQVATARNLLAMRGLLDPDLDRFYRRPGDAFHIQIVATRLRALANRVDRH